MRKSLLLDLVKNYKTNLEKKAKSKKRAARVNSGSHPHAVFLLNQFLEQEQIKNLADDSSVSFRDYLNFLQEKFPNVTQLFEEPYLRNNTNASMLLHKFINNETLNPLIVSNSVLKYEFKKEIVKNESATAIAITSNGNIVTSICAFDSYGNLNTDVNEIVLRDASLNPIKSIKASATAIASLPNGNIITSICVFDSEGNLNTNDNEIALRDASLNSIKSIKASAMAIAPMSNGNIITSICAFDSDGNLNTNDNEIVLRDASLNSIKSIKASATAIAIMSNGNIVTSICAFDADGTLNTDDNEIVLRDASLNPIKSIKASATAIASLSNGNIITTICAFDADGNLNTDDNEIVLRDASLDPINSIKASATAIIPMSNGNILKSIGAFDSDGNLNTYINTIAFNKPILVAVPIVPAFGNTPLLQKANALLLEKAALGCHEFRKGTKQFKNPEPHFLFLCQLPKDILKLIFAYVFPFPGLKKSYIVNNDCFFNPTDKDIKKDYLANEFAAKIFELKFFAAPVKPKIEVNVLEQTQRKGMQKIKNKNCSIM